MRARVSIGLNERPHERNCASEASKAGAPYTLDNFGTRPDSIRLLNNSRSHLVVHTP
jgi:hypothetical protein